MMTAEIQDKTLHVVTNAREIVELMSIEQVFPESRMQRNKRGFDPEYADDSSHLPVKETLKLRFLLTFTDQ